MFAVYFCVKRVESIIGYIFKNKKLLKQAFTSDSYSKEYGGENNEVLAFLGDEIIDYAIVRLLNDDYGKLTVKGYSNSKDEGELSDIKSTIMDIDYFVAITERLNLDKYLVLGHKDKEISKSMKGNLIKAIFGAIALDCSWNIEMIIPVADRILDVTNFITSAKSINPITKLQQLVQKENLPAPEYTFKRQCGGKGQVWICYGNISDLNLTAHAIGTNKKEARCIVAGILVEEVRDYKKAANEYFKAVGFPDAINILHQINKLVQSCLISKPEYEFNCVQDRYGQVVWTCKCRVPDIPNYYFRNNKNNTNRKRIAQRDAAYGLLCFLLRGEDELIDRRQ